MNKKSVCLMTVFVLSAALVSGCSTKTTSVKEQVTPTVNPQKPYNDETMRIMQEIAASKDIFADCSDKKIRKKYDKLSYDAGELAIRFQRQQLSDEELENGMEQMQKYKKRHDKLLAKINASATEDSGAGK